MDFSFLPTGYYKYIVIKVYVDIDLIHIGLNRLFSLDCTIIGENTLNLYNYTLDEKSFYNSLPEENEIIGVKFPQFFKYQRQNEK